MKSKKTPFKPNPSLYTVVKPASENHPATTPKKKTPKAKAKPKAAAASKTRPTELQAALKGYVSGEVLLLCLFADSKSRPSARWLRERTQAGEIPAVKIGGLIFYNVGRVSASLEGDPKAMTETQISKLTDAEKWEAMERFGDDDEAKRAFYLKHLKK